MTLIIRETYRGWDITVQCSHISSKVNHPSRYAAVALAELQPMEDPAQWVDPRVQVLSTGGRSFPTGDLCVGTLVAEAKQLIDALRK